MYDNTFYNGQAVVAANRYTAMLQRINDKAQSESTDPESHTDDS